MLSNPPSHSRELIPRGDANKLQREDYAQTLVLYSVRFIPKFAQILWQRSEMQIQGTKTNLTADSLQSFKKTKIMHSIISKKANTINFIKNKKVVEVDKRYLKSNTK